MNFFERLSGDTFVYLRYFQNVPHCFIENLNILVFTIIVHNASIATGDAQEIYQVIICP
jgi:hypothetical protein